LILLKDARSAARIPVVAIIVIDDGIAIDVHPIEIAVDIQLLQLPV
jgi:hypothetical protein